MRVIISQLDALRKLSGNNQLELLHNFKSDLLKEVLTYTIDTHKKYKINELKYNKVKIIEPTEKKDLTKEDWHNFTTLLDNLVEIKSAKDQHIYAVKVFIHSFNQSDFLEMVLFKDLRLNMAAKKIQCVWPDFCVTYPYMGCKPFTLDNLRKIKYPALAQTKMDGSFCNIIVDVTKHTVEYYSRQSKPQPMQGSLDEELLNQFTTVDEIFTSKYVLTGEVLVWDYTRNKPLPRKISNGILRRQNKTPEELNSIHLVCWDFLPYDKFIERRWEEPYSNRFMWLSTRIKSPRIHIVNTWTVNSLEEALAKFEEQYANGEEGIVVKSLGQVWRDGKPSGQVKVKAEKDCDLRMIEFIEGKGNYAGMCGSIRCISEDGLLEVNLKPRTPKDAQDLWNNKLFYENGIVEVKFNEVIESDSKDKASLYLPVFVEIRDDKTVADTYDYIKSIE